MVEVAEEMVRNLNSIKEYTAWDYISLSLMHLMNVAAITPQIQPAFKQVLGLLLDGQIELRTAYNNGILPNKREPKDS